jgi:protease PrsW
MGEMLRPAVLGLAPVVTFLAALVVLDSYKLVRLRTVVAVVLAGMATALLAYLLHDFLLDALGIGFAAFTRYVSPVTEEVLKAAVIVALIRSHRIGFLVDAAILGFAVGTGFALVENFHYLDVTHHGGLGVWLVRGFGTAIMHGEPGLVAAILLHSAFNHFFLSPFASTLGIAVAFPLLMSLVFTRSDAALGEWLGKGFDADAQTLETIESGRLPDSPIGRYLEELKSKFEGPVLADLLCYLRLHTELALRAKGILMMRESGFDAPVDEATREKFAELRYLERSIGRTGLLAIRPMLHMSHKDLWQLYMLGK